MQQDLGGPVDQHETTTPTERKPLGRRTVLKGAAWSVPAVVAVGVTPAFAASDVPPAPGTLSAIFTKGTGGNPDTWTFTWVVRNGNTARQYTSASVTSGTTTWSGPSTVSPPSGSYSLTVNASTDLSFTFAYTFNGTPDSRTYTITNIKRKTQTFSLGGTVYTGSN